MRRNYKMPGHSTFQDSLNIAMILLKRDKEYSR
jgi:hypothetical protein